MHAAHHRCPDGASTGIDGPADALATLAAAVHRPLRAETLVLALDHLRVPRGIVVVNGTLDADDVIDVVDRVADAAGDHLGAFVVASVRPRPLDPSASDRSDLDRWCELSAVGDDHGIEVLDWFIIGDTVRRLTDEVCERSRW